jgi:hypothetical protein
MKKLTILVFGLFFLTPRLVSAQEITYSEYKNEDDRDINFEILGKMNNSYIIYKNVRWKHMLTIYDNDMRIKSNNRIKFVPDNTFNIDFITYPDHFYMVYQYQKNKVVYCMGVRMDSTGSKMEDPVLLDTTKIPILADNKIYSMVYSQDKQKILIYKMLRRNQMLTLVTKLFDTNLKMIDSARLLNKFDDRRDIYEGMLVDNSGNIVFAKETKEYARGYIEGLDVYCRKPGAKDFKILSMNLADQNIDEAVIKIDNLNKRYILNALYYRGQPANVKGMYTVVIDANAADTVRSAFNELPDSIRSKMNNDGQYRSAFDNLIIREAIVRKDGGFILATEDNYVQSRSNANNSWLRPNYLYNYPYSPSYDYYLANPAYGYYRPLNSYNNWQTQRYYYQNILVLSFDSNLNMEWNTIIPKDQSDDDNDNFLSFSIMNFSAEIHFFYNEENRNRQITSNEALFPNGQVRRYPTLKSREAGYEFMPRLAKQIAYREIIIPCVYRSNIAFARVVFTD